MRERRQPGLEYARRRIAGAGSELLENEVGRREAGEAEDG